MFPIKCQDTEQCVLNFFPAWDNILTFFLRPAVKLPRTCTLLSCVTNKRLVPANLQQFGFKNDSKQDLVFHRILLFRAFGFQSAEQTQCAFGFFTVNKTCTFPPPCNLTLVSHRFRKAAGLIDYKAVWKTHFLLKRNSSLLPIQQCSATQTVQLCFNTNM